jgi:hypothetical protein
LRQRLAEEYADCSALFQRGLQQLNEVAAVLYNLRAEQEAIAAAVSHENEKGDLLMNILGSLLQEVCAFGLAFATLTVLVSGCPQAAPASLPFCHND